MINEIWKDIVDYEGLYQVSNLARVKSLARAYTVNSATRNGKPITYTQRVKEKILKQQISVLDNRKSVELSNGKKDIRYKVYRLVALAFLPNPLNKPQVNHKDGDHTNDVLSNLEWNTPREDKLHAYRLGLLKPAMKGVLGRFHHSSIPVFSIDSTGNKTVYEGISDAARKIGLSKTAIYRNIAGLSQTCQNKKWYYLKLNS